MRHTSLVPTALAIAISSTFCMSPAVAVELTTSGEYSKADHYVVSGGNTLDAKDGSLNFTSGSSTTQRLTVDGMIVNLKDLHVKAGGFLNNGSIAMSGDLSFGALNNGQSVVNNGSIKAHSLSTTWSAGFDNNKGAILDVESGVFDVANTFSNNGTIIIHEGLAHFKTGNSVVFGENATIKDQNNQLVSIKVDKKFTNNGSNFEVLNFEASDVTNNGLFKAYGDFSVGNYYSDADSQLVVDGTATIGYITDKAYGSLKAETLHISKAADSFLDTISANKLIIDSTASLYNLKTLNINHLDVHGNFVAFTFQSDLADSEKVVKLDSAVFDGKGKYSGIQLWDADLNLKSLAIDSDTKGMINFYDGTNRVAKIDSLTVAENGTLFVSAKKGTEDTLNNIVVENAIFANESHVTRKEGNVGLIFKQITAAGDLTVENLANSTLDIQRLNAKGGKVVVDHQLSGDSSEITIDEGASVALNQGVTTDKLNVNLRTMQKGVLDVASVAKTTQTNITVDGKFNNKNAQEIINDLDSAVKIGGDDSGEFDFVIAEGDIYGAITGDSSGSYQQGENTKLVGLGSLTALSALSLRHEMNSLSKRMGELRDAPAGVGAWARAYGSEMEYGSQNMKAKNNSIQVGSDYTVGDWKVGAALTYTDGESSYDKGSADNKSYGAAIYGTWFVPCGAYVDLMAKYHRLDNDFAFGGMNGSFENDAFAVSAETGYRFNFMDGGVFVEPQIGVSYGYIKGETFKASNGVTVDQDDYDSLIGRVGVRTGFKFPKDKGSIYARVSGVYDFQGSVDAIASKDNQHTAIKEDLGGAWLEMGVGANFNWTKNTYTYIDFERTNGGDVKENYRWNVGVRHTF